MTTSKPEVVGYISDRGLQILREKWRPQYTISATGSDKVPYALIRLSDYKALQSGCKKLVEALEVIQRATTHDSIQEGTALGCIAAICDDALAAHRKGGEK